MPRADVYRLQRSADGGIRIACRLTEKAFQQGYATLLRAPDRERAVALDKALWEFRSASFVPHALTDDPAAADCPVRIDSVEGMSVDDAEQANAENAQPAGDAAEGASADAEAEPAQDATQEAEPARLLIHLGPLQGEPPPCERIAEILCGDQAEDAAARLEFYRQRGYETREHQLEDADER